MSVCAPRRVFVLPEFETHDLTADLFCQIVVRGAESAGSNNNITATESRFQLLREALGIVPDGAAVHDGYAHRRKLF